MKKVLLYVVLFCVAVSLGVAIQKFVLHPVKEVKEQMTTNVLLEKIKEACQLVTVEGSFSELMTYETYNYYDLPMFQKKAILKVEAKVSAGYDLQQVEFQVVDQFKTVYIRNIPYPTIQSIDADISYYDIDEGVFNEFDNKELTDLNKKAKLMIRDKAQSSELMLRAEQEGDAILQIITAFLEDSGWKVVVEKQPGIKG